MPNAQTANALTMPATNQEFLKRLFGDRWPDVHVTCFVGDPANIEPSAWKGGRADKLLVHCVPGTNNYYAVSLFSGHARLERDFTGLWVLGVDDVGTKLDAAKVVTLLGEPTYRLETSQGNAQWGYRLETPFPSARHAKALQRAVRRFLTGDDAADPGQEGLNRYMRLPVGSNGKRSLGADGPFKTHITTWSGRLVTEDELDALAALLSVDKPDDDDPTVAPVLRGGPGGKLSSLSSLSSPTATPVVDADIDNDWMLIAMRRLGLVLTDPAHATPMGMGHDITCPWVHEHSRRANSGAIYVPVLGKFKCHHGHCADKTMEHVRERVDEMLREESGGVFGLVHVEFPDEVDPATVPPSAWGIAKPTPANSTNPVVRAFFGGTAYLRERDRFWDFRAGIECNDRSVDTYWTRRLRDELPIVGQGNKARRMRPSEWFRIAGQKVDGLIQWPGEARIVNESGQTLANIWRAPERPLHGAPDKDVDADAVKPWMDLFWHIILMNTLDQWMIGETILDWLALAVGDASIKPGWNVVLTGGQGIGKSLIIMALMRALGAELAQTVTAGDVTAAKNEWMARRLVALSEMKQTTRGSTTPHDQMNRLKEVFDNTNPWLVIDPKYGVKHRCRNVVMGWITSNDRDPLRLERDDRRFLIMDRGDVGKWPAWSYTRLVAWLDKGGDQQVVEYLRRRWETMPDVRRAALMGAAPATPDKDRLIADSRDPVEAWMARCIDASAPDPMAWPDVVSAGYIHNRLGLALKNGDQGLPGHTSIPSLSRIGHLLRQLNAQPLNSGQQVRVQGSRMVLWAVRDYSFYSPMRPDELAKVAFLFPGSRTTN